MFEPGSGKAHGQFLNADALLCTGGRDSGANDCLALEPSLLWRLVVNMAVSSHSSFSPLSGCCDLNTSVTVFHGTLESFYKGQ